ncbi:helix-turn-helix transcriptional regulator [Gryllotalpicola ginsengisoli]|uniref:helix-turn-helix transcriptional regulator n=1 Tax=Gryllotalpicola ginsengisoli TaxID=444608 RepID=UPI000425AAC6|nr:helix-turn-helix transcriptional regulator [Gryllotalpicola ginsengisoli]
MGETSHDALGTDALGFLRSGVSVSLRGLPGSGRSTALRGIADTLEASGWTVVRVRGVAAFSDRPLEALAVADVLAAPGSHRRTPVSAAVAGLERALEATRAIVAVDDSDLLDPASIGALATAITARRVPLLSSASAARTAPELSLPALVHPGVRLVVPPLGFDASYEIVQSFCRGGTVATETVARIHSRAGGLPGLVIAVADLAVREGRLTARDGVWTAGSQLWSPRLARAVEPFLQGLGGDALDGLIKLSLVGAVDVAVAQRLVGWPALEELDERGVLTFVAGPDRTIASVYPPLLAEHLRNERMGARRLRILDEIDDALGQAAPGASADSLLPGLRQARSPISLASDRRAFAGLGARTAADVENREAADAALNRLVHDKLATETLARRAEWEQNRDARSALAYVVPLMVRGADVEELDRVFAEALPHADQRDAAALTAWRAMLWAFGALDPARARRLLDEQRAAAGPWAGVFDAGDAYLTLMLEQAPAHPLEPPGPDVEPVAADALRLTRAQQLIALARPRAALAELDAIEPQEHQLRETVGAYRALALLTAGDLTGAAELARRHYDDGVARLDPALMTAHGYVLALVHLFRGDDAALRDHIGPLLSLGYTPLRQLPFQLGTLVGAARFAARLGSAATARSLAEQAQALGVPIGPFPVMLAAQARAHAQLASGADAAAVADELWAEAERAHEKRYPLTAAAAAVRALELRPDPARAALVRAWATDAEPGGLSAVLSEYAEALAHPDSEQRLAAGIRLLDQGFAGFGLQLQVSAVRDLASSDPERAAVEARRIRDVAAQLGGEYPAYTAALSPADELSDREREVAELAAAGLSNAAIAQRLQLSVRTVENHLYRVFQKLDVENRQELADALGARR